MPSLVSISIEGTVTLLAVSGEVSASSPEEREEPVLRPLSLYIGSRELGLGFTKGGIAVPVVDTARSSEDEGIPELAMTSCFSNVLPLTPVLVLLSLSSLPTPSILELLSLTNTCLALASSSACYVTQLIIIISTP